MDSDDSSELSSIPSSPLSTPPDSPILPPGWRSLTPPPSQDAEDDMPPRKRRKLEAPLRTTKTLTLTETLDDSNEEEQAGLSTLLKTLRKKRKIVVVAGAGISVSAGIPDFRSQHGLFKQLKSEHKLKSTGKDLFDASVYKDDDSTSQFHKMLRNLSDMAASAKPTLFHRLLARLSSEGRLLRLYTQNVDGIDTSLPPLATMVPLNHKGPWPQTIQLHGGLEKMMCQKCQHTSDFEPQIFDGPKPPSCRQCAEKDSVRTNHAGKRSHGVGKLRPRMVLYNEHNPDDEAIGSVVTADLRSRPDAIIVVGTSMKIPGVRRIVKEMCKTVRSKRHGVSIWINRDPIPTGKDFEGCWDVIVKGDTDEVARRVNLRDWDDHSTEDIQECTHSDIERVKARQGSIEIRVAQSPKRKRSTTPPGIMTPKSLNEEMDIAAKNTSLLNVPTFLLLKDKTLRNPASAGRSISQVLGKDEKENKVKSKGLPKRPYKKSNPKISQIAAERVGSQSQLYVKVSKAVAQPSKRVIKKAVPEPLSPLQNHGNIPIPGLTNFSSTEPSPGPESPSYWTNNDTISPTGSIPSGMEKLLN